MPPAKKKDMAEDYKRQLEEKLRFFEEKDKEDKWAEIFDKASRIKDIDKKPEKTVWDLFGEASKPKSEPKTKKPRKKKVAKPKSVNPAALTRDIPAPTPYVFKKAPKLPEAS